MTAQADPVRTLWRRFLRLSVRGLIFVVLITGAGLGWMVRQASIQRDAVTGIWKAGGSVWYDWEFFDGKSKPGAEPWAPRMLVRLMGVDYFGHVTVVNLNPSSTPPDTPLVEVGRLNRLQTLLLNHASVSDAGLVDLKGLTNLSVLGLDGTQVTDAGLVHLKRLTKLSQLYLSNTQVTGAGVNELKRSLPGLKIYR